MMRLCFGCFLRGLSTLKLAILAVMLLVTLAGSGYVLHRFSAKEADMCKEQLATQKELTRMAWNLRPMKP